MASDSGGAIDPFSRLRRATMARIGLGRVGQAIPTAPLLAFRLAHARARDAVHAELDMPRLAHDTGTDLIQLATTAPTRASYLLDPDLGRTLAPHAGLPQGPFDAAIVLADGLSAVAVQQHAPAVVKALLPRLERWRIAPLVAVTQGRVAIGDQIGALMEAALVVVLIGERPGLSAADSLSAYLTWAPRRDRLNSERNCISNIREPGGLAPIDAAARIAWLLQEARRLNLTGIALKDRYNSAGHAGGLAVSTAHASRPSLPPTATPASD